MWAEQVKSLRTHLFGDDEPGARGACEAGFGEQAAGSATMDTGDGGVTLEPPEVGRAPWGEEHTVTWGRLRGRRQREGTSEKITLVRWHLAGCKITMMVTRVHEATRGV